MARPKTPWPTRFWTHVDRGGDGCWLWTGGLDRAGYGVFLTGVRGLTRAAHRLAYELHKGPIPEGLVVDHLCRVHACVRPEHLEAVTQRVNVLRGLNHAANRARQTACVNGHEFTPANTYITPGRGTRQCVACRRIRRAAA